MRTIGVGVAVLLAVTPVAGQQASVAYSSGEIRMLGVVDRGGSRQVLLRREATGESDYFGKGDRAFGYTVDAIDEEWTPSKAVDKDGQPQCVVVERCLDGAEIERTVKEIHVFDDRTELRPASSNPAHKAIVVPKGGGDIGGVEVRVIGRVIKRIRDM